LRLRAQAAHGVGHHDAAISFCQQALREDRPTPQLSAPFPMNRQVSMRMVMARSLWLQGCSDDALTIIEEAIEHAKHDVPQSLANILAWSACPIALWNGDLSRASRWVAELHRQAIGNGMQYSALWAEAYTFVIDLQQDQPMRHGTHIVRDAKYLAFEQIPADILGTLDSRFLKPALLQRAHRGERGWHVPEVFRREAARQCDSGESSAPGARQLLQTSFDIAEEQGALAWQLRTATSMLRLELGTVSSAPAAHRLMRVLEQFKQGLDTRDVKDAQALLQETQAKSVTSEAI
jgi:hypothetical protein